MKKALKSKQNKKIKKLLRLAFVLILIAISGAAVIYGVSMVARAGMDYYGESVTPSNYSLLNKIGQQVKLPKEGIKLFMKVKDPELLKSESDFYADIQKDDYVVIYPSMAIIYDANADKVIKIVILKE
jgi:hypothetical protein